MEVISGRVNKWSELGVALEALLGVAAICRPRPTPVPPPLRPALPPLRPRSAAARRHGGRHGARYVCAEHSGPRCLIVSVWYRVPHSGLAASGKQDEKFDRRGGKGKADGRAARLTGRQC